MSCSIFHLVDIYSSFIHLLIHSIYMAKRNQKSPICMPNLMEKILSAVICGGESIT